MLHSRTKTVKAYGKRNTRVINIHSDFQDAVLDKHHSHPTTAPLRNVLQEKSVVNLIDDTSSDDTDDNEGEEENWSPKKVARSRKPLGDRVPKKKTGRAPRRAVISNEDESPLNEEADIDSRIHVSLESESTSEATTNIDDPSDRSTTRSTHNVSSSSLSSRPVPRQKRHGRKVVESSEEDGSEDGEGDGKASSLASDSGMAEAQESVILEGLNKLSIGSGTDDYRLHNLLALCDHDSASDFTSFIDTHQIASVSATRTKTRGKRAAAAPVPNVFRKIGEASYSEVFGVWSESSSAGSPKVVMKVVPLDMNLTKTVSARSGKSAGGEDDDEVCLTKVDAIAREIEITRLMNGVHEGFVKLHEAHIVRGTYPERLLDSWDEFKKERGSESPRPDCLPENQYYMLLFLENAGTDLESYQFDKATGWRQAVDVLWQVADALHTAEQEAEFEHRDLHEGQVLLSETETGELRTTIIDFGLSRAKSSAQADVIWSHIPEDVFDGQGEQWDVYRAMRGLIENAGNAWNEFHPVTNLMWLHYLTKRLLYATPTLVKPRSKALNRVMSRRDPSRSPIRRRTTRNTAAILATPMTSVNTDQGAELEAWEKLRRFETACKAGLAEWANGKVVGARHAKKGQQARAKGRLGGGARLDEAVASVGEATLWFVANE